MSLDRGRRGRGPERGVPDPSSETRQDRYTGFFPPPEDDGARLSEGVGAISGGRFDDCPAGAGSSGRPGTSHKRMGVADE